MAGILREHGLEGRQDCVTEKGPGNKQYDELLDWLRHGGAEFPALKIVSYFNNEMAVETQETIPSGKVVIKIPLSHLITIQMAEASPIGQKMLASNEIELSAMKHCLLAVFLLIDLRNSESHFQPYYRALPTRLDHMPIFWSKEDLAELQGSYFLAQVSDRAQDIDEDYEEICRIAPEFRAQHGVSVEDFRWARMIISSRNFNFRVGDTLVDALVPLADMLNHKRPRMTKWAFSNREEAFIVTALQTIPKGDQVFDSYGKKCNSRFLLNYGFTIEDNTECDGRASCQNECHLFFTAPTAPSLHDSEEAQQIYNIKRKWLDPYEETKRDRRSSSCSSKNDTSMRSKSRSDSSEEGIIGISCRITSDHYSSASKETLSIARLLSIDNIHDANTVDRLFDCSTDAENSCSVKKFKKDADDEKFDLEPISYTNEMQALELICTLCQEQLDKYPTTIEEDEDLLESQEIAVGSNRYNAIILRLGEKRVCQFWLDVYETIGELRQVFAGDNEIEEIEGATEGSAENDEADHISFYISRVIVPLLKKESSDENIPDDVQIQEA